MNHFYITAFAGIILLLLVWLIRYIDTRFEIHTLYIPDEVLYAALAQTSAIAYRPYVYIVDFPKLVIHLFGKNADTGNYYKEDSISYHLFNLLMTRKLVHYYAAPREQFSIKTGVNEAYTAGVDYVILEDMS